VVDESRDDEVVVAWVEKRRKLGVGGRYLYGLSLRGLILRGHRCAVKGHGASVIRKCQKKRWKAVQNKAHLARRILYGDNQRPVRHLALGACRTGLNCMRPPIKVASLTPSTRNTPLSVIARRPQRSRNHGQGALVDRCVWHDRAPCRTLLTSARFSSP
jgi:hypothetical protein